MNLVDELLSQLDAIEKGDIMSKVYEIKFDGDDFDGLSVRSVLVSVDMSPAVPLTPPEPVAPLMWEFSDSGKGISLHYHPSIKDALAAEASKYGLFIESFPARLIVNRIYDAAEVGDYLVEWAKTQ